MGVKERERTKVLERVEKRELALREAAAMTRVGYRQMKKLEKRYEREEDC